MYKEREIEVGRDNLQGRLRQIRGIRDTKVAITRRSFGGNWSKRVTPGNLAGSRNSCDRGDRRGPNQSRTVTSCRACDWLPSGFPSQPETVDAVVVVT